MLYGHKKIIYEHMDHGITTHLMVHIGSNFNEFIVFHCTDEEGFGWSVPMQYAIFVEDLDCHKILPEAKKFCESQESANKLLN